MRIIAIECPECGYRLPGSNSLIYVTDKSGNRIECGHPGEGYSIWRILRTELNWLQQKLHSNPSNMLGHEHFKVKLSIIQRMLGFKNICELVDERTGVLYNFICTDCSDTFKLDIQRDVKTCPSCHSALIEHTHDMVGNTCPKCKSGLIIEWDTGLEI